MRRSRPDFRSPKRPPTEQWYDLDYDALLIEQSLAKQYGVLPSRQGELHYSEWAKLVSGLMNDTPLGQVVSIRSEADRNVLKNFSKEQNRIRSEWRRFVSERYTKEQTEHQMRHLEEMIAGLFGR